MQQIHKYPRTQHIEGSRFQAGDEDLEGVPYAAVAGRQLVIEEKLDGANAGLSFGEDGELRLQSRGHYLTGGGRERHFNLFKSWAQTHQGCLYERLGRRYLMYGEWLYAKHTVFYDGLPHYFLEFDILDQEQGRFLCTSSRQRLLRGLPVVSVPVLFSGKAPVTNELSSWVRQALYKTADWRARLLQEAATLGQSATRVLRETDESDLAEGLYLKIEGEGQVVARYKFVRASFLATVVDSESHWQSRPILPNQLAPEVDLFG